MAERIIGSSGNVADVDSSGRLKVIADSAGGGEAVTIADGADVAQGATTDAATANTVIGRLKKIISVIPAALGQATMANSLPVTLASDQASIPVASTLQASTAVVGVAISPNQTGAVYSGTTALTPASTFANVAASQTDSNVVTATAAKIIRVLALSVQCGGTSTTIVFNTRTGAGAGTAISMTFQNAANGGAVLPYNPLGWFDTVAGDILSVTTGAGSTTGIQVVYAKV